MAANSSPPRRPSRSVARTDLRALSVNISSTRSPSVAERIREGFAVAVKDVDGRPVCATVSIGIAYCEEVALDVPALLAQSDQALYFAKEKGRNRVEVASLDMIMERNPGAPSTAAEPAAAARAPAKIAAA
jgi:hypothetical protein